MRADREQPLDLDRRAYYWLAAALSLVMLPHARQLPWWLLALYAAALAWRWSAAERKTPLPGRWPLLAITVAAVGGVLLSYHTLFGRDAGVALLAAMTAMKFLEARALRDAMVLIFLGYFLIMANLLYDQSLFAAGYLLAALAVLLAAQVIVHREHAGLPRLASLRLGLRMLLQSIPIMLVLFILFPRIPGPLWGLPKDAHSGLTGLSDEMAPGAISRLIQSDEVAFRVRFDGEVPPSRQLYWRGPVLWRYDGRTWRTWEEPLLDAVSYTAVGEPVHYAVILEPHGKRWLFALDLPTSVPDGGKITPSFQLLRVKPVVEVLRYEVRSYLNYQTGALPDWQRWQSSRVPSGVHPRAQALAAEWRQRDPAPEALVRTALNYFREEPFYYTLTPPLLGENGIDEFLFETRRGFCEHYAGSFTFLMRAAGVPARVVTGYQGGERNALGNYVMVRQSDAHAWAEVWIEGDGWVRVDPTAAVAPGRIESGVYAAVTDPQELPFLARRDNLWLRRLALGWDSLQNTWNEWVLAYGPERQRQFLSNLGLGPVDWQAMVAAMILGLSAVAFALLGFRELRRYAAVDPTRRAWRSFCAKLARRGLARRGDEGPLAFAERVVASRPDLAARVRLIARLYAGLRYGRLQRDESRRLQRLVRAFRA